MAASFDNILATCLVVAVLLLLNVAAYRFFFSPISDVPGPFGASVTRLWHVFHILKGDNNLQAIALHEKHGHFVRIAPNEVSVSHPDGPRLILQAPLRKARWYRMFTLPDYRFESPMSTLDPKEKVERSKWLLPGYSLSNILKSEEYISTTIGHLLDWMDKYAESHKPMDLDKFFTYTAFDVAGEAIFSQPYGFITEGRDIRGSIRNNEILSPVAAVAGFYIWIYILIIANPIVSSTGIGMGHLFDTAQTAMRKRMENPDARFDLAAHWFKTHERNPNRLSIREIETQATLSVGAAADTVSCAMQSFVYHMIQHPVSWQRARDEVNAAQARSLYQDRVVSFKVGQNLPYLQACIKEAMRLFGPTGMGLPRVAPKGGLKIGDRHFPEGIILSVHSHVIHKSTECWGPDAREWNPDRWLADDIASKDKYWLVFGMGYNACPGQHLAKVQISKMAATIVRDYDIVQIDPKNEWKWKAYFNLVPHSWPVYIEKRKDEK